MADEKKYTAREAAYAVLKKTQEMLLAKAESKNPDKKADAELGEKVEHLVENHMVENKAAEKQEGHKIMKSDEAKPAEASDKAFEPKPGHAKEGDPRLAEQKAPEANPKENAEGNNPMWGTAPGHKKLGLWCAHIAAKRRVKAGV